MRYRTVIDNYRGLLSRMVGFLEYLFLFTVIVECNSMYTSTQLADMTTAMPALFYGLALALVAVLLVLHALLDPKAVKKLKGFIPLWLALVAYAGAFYLLNVRRVSDARRENYIRNFLALLPLLTLLFKLKQQKGEGLDLLYKHSDIVCVVAAMSLAVYLASVFHVNTMPSDPIYTRWGGQGSIQARINLLNVCQFIPKEKWQISGVELLRNLGFFVEALMFSIPLITALHTELFLRKRADCRHILRAVLLSAALLSANSTIGVMLMAIAWGAKAVSAGAKSRKWWLGALVVCLIVGACALLFVAKKGVRYEATEVSSSSISDHIEDFKAGLKAFLHRPLLGGGYNDEACIRAFMSASKVAKNPGLSNSVATVLGEGGAMLGALCMLPFLICALYVFRRGKPDRDMALWAVGPLGLYVGVIFVYHMFLILLIAFGYSLVEVRRVEGGGFPWRFSLAGFALDDGSEGAAQRETVRRQRKRALGLAGLCVLAGALLVWAGVPLFKLVYSFMRTHQFSMSQSPLKAFGFATTVLLHGVCIGNLARREAGWKRLPLLLAWDAVYLLIYPRLYSDVATLLTAHHSTGGRLECAALLGVYYAGSLLALEAPRVKMWLSAKGLAAVGVAVVAAAGMFFLVQNRLDRLAPVDEALAGALNELTDAASGKVFAGELPSLYRRVNPGLDWPATGTSGFEGYESASIVYPKGENRWELFERGFEVAELTQDVVVYTNDESVIAALTERGYGFYRYYPYERAVDLEALAYRNGLERGVDGALRVDDGNSLEKGPSDTLEKGKYTVRYALRIDPAEYAGSGKDAQVCSLVVSYGNKNKDVALKKITVGQFDEEGNAQVDVPFELKSFSDLVEYKVLAQPNCAVALQELGVRQTPDHITTIQYNCYRKPAWEAYYHTDGTVYIQSTGYAALRREYDVGGSVKAVRYFDADLRPVLTRKGYAEVRYGYNSKRTRNYEAYFGADGQPIRLKAGYAAMKTDFDEYGCAVRVCYFDTDGKPVLLPKGYAEVRSAYDERKQLIYEAYYGIDGERVFQTGGYSALKKTYDADGRVEALCYLGAEDEPVAASGGYAEKRYEYDMIGRAYRELYFDVNGAPAPNTSGYAILEKTFDESGHTVRENYFDGQGRPVACGSGYAEIRYVLDQYNRAVSHTYHDANGDPVTCSSGYYGVDRSFDALGNCVSMAYTDADGNGMLATNRCAGVERAYDEHQNLVSESYVNLRGEAMLKSGGIGEVRKAYNELNQCVQEAYYDLEGNPTENGSGVWMIRREYNSRNETIREEYLNLEGGVVEARGYQAILREYSPNHTLRRELYVDEDGAATVGKAGYAQKYYEYDDSRNRVAVIYRDVAGNVVENNKGVASIRYEYDGRKVVRELYYNADMAGVISSDGYAGIEKGYDELGNNITTTYLGVDGQPMENKAGVATVRREYDALRNCVAEYYYDAQGRPTENDSGVAEIHRTYDGKRKKVSEEKRSLSGEKL